MRLMKQGLAMAGRLALIRKHLAGRIVSLLATAAIALGALPAHAQGNVVPPNGTHSQEVVDLSVQTAAGPVVWKRVFNGTGWRFNRGWDGISASYKPMLTQNTGGGSPMSSTSSGEPEVCWIWVDEDWQPTDGVVGLPPAGTVTDPVRVGAESYVPGNRPYSQLAQPLSASVGSSFASACGAIGGNLTGGTSGSIEEFEGYRKGSALYVGSGGTYIFKNRYVLKKQAVQRLPVFAGEPAGGTVSLGQLESVAGGWRWSDRAGDWAEYDDSGRISRYGDKNNNTVWMQRNAAGQMVRISAAANGATSAEVVITLHYNASGFLVQAKDYPQAGNALDLPQRVVSYGYDAYGRMTSVTDVRAKATQYAYDPKARLTQTTDPMGNVTKLVYGTDGTTVKQMIAADGGVSDFAFSYDDTKKLFYSKSQGPATASGRRVEDYTHDRAGDLVRYEVNGRAEIEIKRDPVARTETRINARGFTIVYTKNEFEQIVQQQNQDGSKQFTQYEARLLNPVEFTDETGVKTRFEYDTAGNLVKRIDGAGLPDERVTEFVVDASGRPTRVTRKGRTEPNATVTGDAVWQITYDASGQVSQTTDAEGNVRSYLFNRVGTLTKYIDPLNNVILFEADAAGNLTKVTDALGHARSYSYDAGGRLIAVTDARGKTSLAQYDAMNHLAQITNPVGGQLKLTNNTLGLPIRSTDEDGRTVMAEYDSFLRIIKLADGLSNTATFGYQVTDGSAAGTLGSLSEPTDAQYPTFRKQVKYDGLERPTSQTLLKPFAQGTDTLVSSQAYDARGLVKSETDANGNIRQYSYDSHRALAQTIDALGNKTTAKYDSRGNLIQLTDANSNSYRFSYDRNNRLTQEILPLGQTTTYMWDAAGNLGERTDPNNVKTSYSYDASNRLTELRQTKNGRLLRTTAFTWDEENHLTAWSDTDATRPAGQQIASATATYDDAGRKTAETTTYPNPAGGSFALGYAYSYSAAGRKTRITWPDGTAIDYSYSLHGELEQVNIPGEGGISVNQFKWVAPTILILPGGTIQEKTFDGLLNLESLKVKTPGQQTILTLQDSYGKVQEIQTSNRADTANNISRTRATSYQYDDEIRLAQVQTNSGGLFSNDTEVFTLDAVGNRTEHTKAPGAWQYDANNRLINRPGQGGAVSYEYDAAGSQTRKTEGARIRNYVYDASSRLAEITDGSNNLIARYGYDPLDRRIWKETYRDKSGQLLAQAIRSYYLYSDEGLIAEASQAITLNANQTVTAAEVPQIATQYGPRPDSEFSTGVLFVKTRNVHGTETVVAYFHLDHLNAAIQASDMAGNIVWIGSYDAFGRATVITPGSTTEKPMITFNLRLPGQYEDVESGLHYNFTRYYDPENGRYISQDPIGLGGGLNYYVYAGAYPTGRIDPEGLWSMDPVWGAIYDVTGRYSPSQEVVDFGAGFGDVLTFGLTKQARNLGGIGSVNTCSKSYRNGEYVGIAASILTGFAGGSKAVASKLGPHTNFSHSLFPQRALRSKSPDYVPWLDNAFGRWLVKGKNRLNGDYLPVSRQADLHARMDLIARRGLDGDWLRRNPAFGDLRREINRMPYTPGASAYGAASFGLNFVTNNECACK